MKKVGVFGGTFNPIHFGHIHLALSLKEAAQLDEIIFSPNFESPFQEKSSVSLSAEKRLEMVKIALDGVPGCFVTDYEVVKKGTSYTIDLVKYVKNFIYSPQDELFLLLADDLLEHFFRWKDVEELVSIAIPLVGTRTLLKQASIPFLDVKIQNSLNEGSIEIPIMEISSSLVRERLKKGLYVGHLVPQKVLDYIYLNKLYL